MSFIQIIFVAPFVVGICGFNYKLNCLDLSPVFRNCNCVEQRSTLHCPEGSLQINGPLPQIPFGVRDLDLRCGNVTSIPVGAIPRTVQRLVIQHGSLTTLPADLPMGLITLDVYNNSLLDLRTVSTLPNLAHIDVRYNSLQSLPTRWTPTMQHLQLNNNKLTEIPDLHDTNIKYIVAHNNSISYIERLPASLRELSIPWNKMTTMDFLLRSNLPNLAVIDCFGNPDFDLNQAGAALRQNHYYNPSLQQLLVGDSNTHQFPSWICSVFPHLTHLSFYSGRILGIFAEPYTTICNRTITVELHGNHLDRGIDVLFFKSLFPNLKYMTLSATFIKCSCDLFTYIRENYIVVNDVGESAKCGFPEEWRGFSLSDREAPINCSVVDEIQETETYQWIADVWLLLYVLCAVLLLAGLLAFILYMVAITRRRLERIKRSGELEVLDEALNGCPPQPSLSSKRRAMKLPRSVTKVDDIVVPLSQRRRFKDVKYDESAYLMPLSERTTRANGGRTVSGVYENDNDPNLPNQYIDLDELDFSIPAEDAYNYSKHPKVLRHSVALEMDNSQPQYNADSGETILKSTIQNALYIDHIRNDQNANELRCCELSEMSRCTACETDTTPSQNTDVNPTTDYVEAKHAYLTMLPDKTYIDILPEPVVHKLHEKDKSSVHNEAIEHSKTVSVS